jgi:hypothetical protein
MQYFYFFGKCSRFANYAMHFIIAGAFLKKAVDTFRNILVNGYKREQRRYFGTQQQGRNLDCYNNLTFVLLRQYLLHCAGEAKINEDGERRCKALDFLSLKWIVILRAREDDSSNNNKRAAFDLVYMWRAG